MVSYSDEQIKTLIVDDFTGKRITILAPVIRARKVMEIVPTNRKARILKVRVNGRSRYYWV
jgi:excinuclease ABC subunit A